MIANRPKSNQRDALRARIILEASGGLSNTEIARRERVSLPTVGKWRSRYARQKIEALADAPRSGAPRSIDDKKVEEVLTKTLETTPRARTHWSSRLLAKEAGISEHSALRIRRAFGLKPHRVDSFKLSANPMFVEKVRHLVALSLNPPDKAIVLCVDEKSQTQALERSQPILPLRPGLPSVRLMIMCVTGLFLCLPLTIQPPNASWVGATSVTATRNSWPSWTYRRRVLR